ncbi:MAG: hypothetical protein RL186_52 [Pseudomonadota bacterium]|jgi:UPF0176 protein
MNFKVCALYKFAPCPDFEDLRGDIRATAKQLGILGTLLLAPEGINGTIAGTPDDIDAFVAYLLDDPLFGQRFHGAEIKYAGADTNPFVRMKVRLKREIVTLRAPKADPNVQVGTYVAPSEWNTLLRDPEIILVDTRNNYEIEEGSFRGAIDPNIRTFTGFKGWAAQNLDAKRDKKIAMFCTGGIRCEKASSYLLAEGFEEVYHLQGGILAYLDQVPKAESLYEGGCFVFDSRQVVGGEPSDERA